MKQLNDQLWEAALANIWESIRKVTGNKEVKTIKIQKDGEKPIYESNGISTSNEFDVEIDESGTYTVEVTGKKAKGSVSFIVQSN